MATSTATSTMVELRTLASAERDELEKALQAGAGGATWVTTITRQAARKLLDALRREDERVIAMANELDTLRAERDTAEAMARNYYEVIAGMRGDFDPDCVIPHGADEDGSERGGVTTR